MTRSNGQSLRAGATLGRYRILEHIGTGGMGEVYRARDTDLERDVAIKVLPREVVGDTGRVRRFIQEAKAASALNHPNIVVIHEIGVSEERHFIAMELIDGETLRQRIEKSNRDLKTLLSCAAQAADALAKAHAAGIIHRDLKPDNLMITRDGFAKVLDFGVAKLTESAPARDDASATDVRVETSAGVVLGTIGYMSPEQAEGRGVDARSDIFSFGCILYEIATRERAFRGRSQVDVLHAIVHDDPRPVTEINPKVPGELRRIIRRCLEKDPDQRFQSMKDLANALRDLVDEYDELTIGSGVAARHTFAAPPARPSQRIGIAVAIATAGAFALYLLRGESKPAAPLLSQMRIAPVTTHGQAVSGALSPDGRYLAYTTYHRGSSAIRVRQLATNSEIEVRPPTRATYYATAQFSPDGQHLYVVEYPGGGATAVLSTLPSLGGEPREVIRDVASPPSFSSDGMSMAFLRGESLFVAGANGANARGIATARAPGRFAGSVSWSPDGRWIAAVTRTTGTRRGAGIELISPDGTERRALTTDRWSDIDAVAWLSDTSGLIAAGAQADTGIAQLWTISRSDGRATRITNDLNKYIGVSRTADGRLLATVQTIWRARIWRLDLAENRLTPITDDQVSHIPVSFELLSDGTLLFHSSEGGAGADLWALSGDGATRRQLTTDPARELSPTAPRAEGIVYFRRESEGAQELWSMNPRGGAQRLVAKLPASAEIDASPDGRWVVTATPAELIRVSTADGSRRTIARIAVARATYSPDGRLIAVSVRGEPRTLILDADSGAVVRELPRTAEQRSRTIEWSADSRNLIVVLYGNGADNLWLQPIDGGARRRITKFTTDAIGGAQASADGRSIWFSRGTSSGNAVLISNYR